MLLSELSSCFVRQVEWSTRPWRLLPPSLVNSLGSRLWRMVLDSPRPGSKQKCVHIYTDPSHFNSSTKPESFARQKELRGRISGLRRLLNILPFSTNFTNWQELPVRPDQYVTSRESVVVLHLLNRTRQMSAHQIQKNRTCWQDLTSSKGKRLENCPNLLSKSINLTNCRGKWNLLAWIGQCKAIDSGQGGL